MSDQYIVQWRHLRWPKNVDDLLRNWYRGRLTTKEFMAVLDAYGEPVPMFVLRDAELYPAQRGGITECTIRRVLAKDEDRWLLERVAHAEAVCSWRDQFDRRAGRLYSLAYALCEWDVSWETALAVMEQYMPTQQGSDPGGWYTISMGIQAHDHDIVKVGCDDIVAAWRKPKHDDWRDAVQNLYHIGMQMCDDYCDDGAESLQEQWEYYADLFDASDAMYDAMATPVLNGDKREVASICDQIVKEWRRDH